MGRTPQAVDGQMWAPTLLGRMGAVTVSNGDLSMIRREQSTKHQVDHHFFARGP